jgi:HNH endonuclease
VKFPLTRGQCTEIDDLDFDKIRIFTWHATQRRDGRGWYAKSTQGIRMHRLLLNPPSGLIVDHINGDGLDNRRTNLRIGTQSNNCVNRLRTPGKFLRGARPKKNRWQASIKLNGKQRHLGYFASELEAHNAYLVEATRLYGDWMPLPSPPSKEGA